MRRLYMTGQHLCQLSLSPSLFRLFSDLHWAINNVIPSRALAIDYTEKANQLTRQQKINKREKQPEANEQLRKEKKAHTAAHRLEQTAKTIKIDKLKKKSDRLNLRKDCN